MRFFFAHKKRILDDFSAVFNEGGEQDEFNAKWGWYDTLFKLAGEDVTKIPEITKMPIRAVYLHMGYLSDRNAVDSVDL